MKRLFAIALATSLAAIAGPAAAASLSGCYIGATAGASMLNNKVDISGIVTVDGFGSDGWLGGARLGCDLQMQKFVFGVLGDFDWMNNTSSVSSPYVPGGIANLSYETQWDLGARVGFLVTQTTLIYALAAYTELNPSDLAVLGKNFSVSSFQGYAVGTGIETDIGNNFRLGLEYRHNMYDNQQIAVGKYSYIDFDPTNDTMQATLTYHFGATAEEEKYLPPLK